MMVYDSDQRARLRARQFQRLHAESSSNPDGPLPFCDLLTHEVLTLASKLEPDPNRKLDDGEADWDPNWIKTQQSLATTLRHFTAAAQRLGNSSGQTDQTPDPQPAPPDVVDEKRLHAREVGPKDKTESIPNAHRTRVQDPEEQIQRHGIMLAEKDTAIVEMQRQVEKMQNLVTNADETMSRSAVQFEMDMKKMKEELARERILRQELEAKEKDLVEEKRVRVMGSTKSGRVRGGPAVLNDENKDALDFLIELMLMRTRARTRDA
ncbi:hypothetical protein FPOA_09205 [Fusarium poae]|uniref:Uncharacterized protein n=1 Tax=Fusarium poae TaxID=36050 RepID=A0A1B8AQQ9_FUSPO|nr:hypothetical protein FPOA_09205 [Fusarium poae]